MNEKISACAARIVDLINSAPRSPTQAQIEAVLGEYWPQTEAIISHDGYLAAIGRMGIFPTPLGGYTIADGPGRRRGLVGGAVLRLGSRPG